MKEFSDYDEITTFLNILEDEHKLFRYHFLEGEDASIAVGCGDNRIYWSFSFNL